MGPPHEGSIRRPIALGTSAVYDRSNGFRVTSNLVSLLRKQVDHLVLPLTNCSPLLIVTIALPLSYVPLLQAMKYSVC